MTTSPRRMAPVSALVLAASIAAADLPDGLRLHLSNDEGIEAEGPAVTRWRDLSGHELDAIVPDGYTRPEHVADPAGVRFSHGRLLRIEGNLLPADTAGLTVIAVVRPDSTAGVSILANRHSAVPLIQLDVDEDGMARFIVRDVKLRTLRSLVPAHLGKPSVVIGTLRRSDDDRYQATVQVDGNAGPVVEGELSMPLAGNVTWIGGLALGQRLYHFDGVVLELLVYDRALPGQQRQALVKALTAKHGIQPPPESEPDSFDILNPAHKHAAVSAEIETEVCVVGAGSGGIGAAIAAARRGVRVTLVERQAMLGGTGTNAFVSAWEPGPGCSIAEEIYTRMTRIPGATGVATWHANVSKFPMGQWYVTESARYEDTLRRAGMPRHKMACIPYIPEALDQVVRDMLTETANVMLLDRTTFFRAETDGDRTRVDSILVEDATGKVTRVRAKVFIDATGCVYVCRSAGCETMLGVDPKTRFNESAAPEKGQLQLNAISRCYMVRPSDKPARAEPPRSPEAGFRRCAHVTGWKDGSRVINPLPMLPGRALVDFGYDECMRRSEDMVRAHWHWLQQQPEFGGYELHEIAPMLGIRESYRVWTEYVLREADLDAGLNGQTHDDIIAVADHPCDIHGAGGHLTSVDTAYGIPYRCLIPRGNWENLLVACRGSGFSRIAASSCRLQRTIMQLGHAAGVAAAMAAQSDCSVEEIDVPSLVRELDARSRYPQ